MQDYGSSDSGASLGDILGAALQSKREAEETASEEEETASGEIGKGET